MNKIYSMTLFAAWPPMLDNSIFNLLPAISLSDDTFMESSMKSAEKILDILPLH